EYAGTVELPELHWPPPKIGGERWVLRHRPIHAHRLRCQRQHHRGLDLIGMIEARPRRLAHAELGRRLLKSRIVEVQHRQRLARRSDWRTIAEMSVDRDESCH